MPMAPTVSALARQTIKTAYDELDRTINPGDKRNLQNTTLQQVRKAALDIENQLASRRSLCNMRRLMPLFQGLEHYSKVVDILCNGTPYLPWIWAPITLILRVASEYVEAFEQIIKGYSRIAESLKRFEILSDAFIKQPDFQQTLAVFYADILKFHKYAYKFIRRSTWKLTFLTSWGRFERRFNHIFEDLKQHGTLIDLEANAHNIAEAKRMREDIRKWREESQNQAHRDEIEENARQYESIASWLNINESDQLAIFDSTLSEAEVYDGNCGWFLRNPKVSSWADSKPDTPILWLKGSAGTGKSVLCAQLINFMKEKKLIIHHFCTYLYASSTTYEQILRSLLLQLLRKDHDLVAHVYHACVLEKKPPTVRELEKLLQTLLESISNNPYQVEYIWVIVDGLDECEPDKQARLIRLINQVTSKPSLPGSTVCKFLISSRAPSNSLECLRKKQTISLAEEKDCLHLVIRQYIAHRLRSLGGKLRQLEIEALETEAIQTEVVTKADGMFLYARLVMDYLASNIFFSSSEIKESVSQLPKQLTDFYQKILTQILIQLDPRSTDRIRCVLTWIAFAKRPLQKFELLSAITFSFGDPDVTRLAPEYILQVCGALIEERRDSTLAFIHISVKEFLQAAPGNIAIQKEQALREHGVATITCLLSGLKVFGKTYREEDKILRVAKGIHGFHVYATEFWTEYLLSYILSDNGTDVASLRSPIALALQLADELEICDMAGFGEAEPEINLADERLASLQPYAVLHKHVVRALKARSLRNLESAIFQAHASEWNNQHLKFPVVTERISAMLASYQHIVGSLLGRSYCPGLPAEELELFKTHFATAAFTCRLNSCPRATLGFQTEQLLSAHEMTHVRCFRCTFPGCQYPPMVSSRALKSHISKYHNHSTTRKVIRRVALANPNRNLYADAGSQPQPQLPVAGDAISLRGQFASTASSDDRALPRAQANYPISQMIRNPISQESPSSIKLQTEGHDVQPDEGHLSNHPENFPSPQNALDRTLDDINTGLVQANQKEYAPYDIDELGEGKINADGRLNGGRKYRCRTFLLPGSDLMLFAFASECAVILRYRDADHLFHENSSLIRHYVSLETLGSTGRPVIRVDDDDRIPVVTAWSIFRQFGSRMIVDGRRVRDDYWESRAREEGYTENDVPWLNI